MAVCAEDTVITWGHVQAFVGKLDQLAQDLNTPSYVSLENTPPFTQTGPVPFQGALSFAVNNLVVSSNFLTGGVQSTNAYSLPSDLETLANQGDLFFLMAADGCICKTILRVVNNGGSASLVEVPNASGCCQSLFVPQGGDTLGSNQYFINHVMAEHWNATGSIGRQWEEGDKCVNTGGGLGFKFSAPDIDSPLTHANRGISGEFVWPMRADYMQQLIGKLNYIIDCNNNNGAKKEKLKYEDGTYLEEGKKVTLQNIIDTLKVDGDIAENPGCMTEYPTLPWNTPTCQGTNCDDTGLPLFYCETLLQLDKIIDKAGEGIQPYTDDPDAEAKRCGPEKPTCAAMIEARTASGGIWICGLSAAPGQQRFCGAVITDTYDVYRLEFDDEGWVIGSEYIGQCVNEYGYYYSPCEVRPAPCVPADDCSIIYDPEDWACEAYPEDQYDIVFASTEVDTIHGYMPSCDLLTGMAKSSLYNCWGVGPDNWWPEYGATGLSAVSCGDVDRAYWRIVVTHPRPGEPGAAAFYDVWYRYTRADGAVFEDMVSCNPDYAAYEYRSAWTLDPYPDDGINSISILSNGPGSVAIGGYGSVSCTPPGPTT